MKIWCNLICILYYFTQNICQGNSFLDIWQTHLSFAYTVLLNVFYLVPIISILLKTKLQMLSVFKKTYFKQYILIDVLYMYKLLHNFYKITVWVEKLCYGTCTCIVVWNQCNYVDSDFDFFLLWNARSLNLCIKHDGCNLIWSMDEECHNHTQLYYVDEM